ncbi:MAG: chloride channel protein, partial [Rhodospirillaceae bacterium]|nr:chloride channel protein [Rhodospirillaceae bacterium]
MVGGISGNNEGRELGWLPICFFAVLVGGVSGFGAWLFRLLIGLIHNFLFLGEFSLFYDANIHTPASPWGAGVILVPVVGALGVVWLVKNFAPEAKGHGVPEVMDAIYFKQGRIRPVVAVVKSLASALSIGSGGSVGREGPIIQIGAAFGSTLGQLVVMPTHQRNLLIAAGAGAGIAATFNVPLGGLVFAIELLMVSISAKTILPVAIATVTGTYFSRMLLGMSPSFDIPALQLPPVHEISPLVLILFIPFGALIGLIAVVFTRGIYWAEDKF